MQLEKVTFFVVATGWAALTLAASPSPDADAARNEARSKLGFVPTFLATFPDEGVAGAWEEMQAVEMNPNAAVPPKYKQLIALGVAANIPCDYCVTYHTAAARNAGATERELREAVALAGIVRHWSTYLNGSQLEDAVFNKDVSQLVERAQANKGKPMPQATFTDAKGARDDIRRTFGFVPTFLDRFPESALPGAWKEMRNLQIAQGTAIPNKYKELIGLGVAAQIPCHYCVTFHTRSAKELMGATDAEVGETLAMSGLVRHWSTFVNGTQVDKNKFKGEVERMFPKAPTGAAGSKP